MANTRARAEGLRDDPACVTRRGQAFRAPWELQRLPSGVGSGTSRETLSQLMSHRVSGGSLTSFSPGSWVRACIIGRGGLAGGSVFLLLITRNADKGPRPPALPQPGPPSLACSTTRCTAT